MDQTSDKSQENQNEIQEFPTITLRKISLSDVDDFMAWASDERVARFCIWDTYTSKEQAEDFIKNKAIPHPWLRVICIENRAIGTISVTPFSEDYYGCRAELGYAIAHRYWGRGIVTSAVKMVVSTIFKEWPHLKRLQAVAYVDNTRSHRVMEKAGLLKEGVLRNYAILNGKPVDVVMYSILGNDPRVGVL
ncbi:hypothetical protein C2S52_014718 [Perilla frutescens var. hirtella]|uniref:N-acetyltransferase domain-containing protein n=1 Tax=Perilla frutescens var. hirtella TaxID=608512 RepID=A0AAD4IUH0_PERFH|nr:hypothetical protein C2S52_014718 [Perilla frutescens var. hirtella]KAH6821587.1 hypothetical protein C2S53_016697 [Perilla frutescens var. hirtella]